MQEREKAAYKVALMYDTPTSKTYQLLCNCGDPEHNWVVDIELEKQGPLAGPMVTIYGDMYYYESWYSGYSPGDIWRRITMYWKRWGAVLRLLFTGYLKMNTDLLILDEKHLDSFIGILEEGRAHCLRKKNEEEANGTGN